MTFILKENSSTLNVSSITDHIDLEKLRTIITKIIDQ